MYATIKNKKRDALKNALEGKIFDYFVKGFRNRRMTRLLLCTVNLDRSEFTCEEAWAALRSTPVEQSNTVSLRYHDASLNMLSGVSSSILFDSAYSFRSSVNPMRENKQNLLL